LEGIFKLKLFRPQYWVIDALDECKNSDLIVWLLRAVELKSVRIFVTCRNAHETYGEAVPKTIQLFDEMIPPSSTGSDISLFLSTNMKNIPALGSNKDEARASTMRLILDK
jgi:hypothetical protein